MEYTVNGSDTLERIAASHDCTVGELMKMNRMSSRMVFPGQKIVVPVPSSDDVFEQAGSVNKPTSAHSSSDRIRKGPGGPVPTQRGNLGRAGSAPIGTTDDADQDCLQRFLKIKVKQVTESDGTVSGTLLVTPNCLMFDPDVTHALVKEKGQNFYGMVANMDEIMSVSVYKEIAALTGDTSEKKKDIFDPSHVRTKARSMEDTGNRFARNAEFDIEDRVPVSFSCEAPDSDTGEDCNAADRSFDDQNELNSSSSKIGSESYLPSISEETKLVDSPLEDRARAVSDAAEGIRLRSDLDRSRSCSLGRPEERPRSFSELDAPSPQGISRFSPNNARRSFGKLGRTLSERAKSVQNSVTQGAEKVAHGVVTHTKSAADTLQTGIETSVKVVGGAANAAANQAKVASSKVVDMGSSIVSDGINGVQEMFIVEEQRTASQMKREQSLATLEGLRERTQQARDDAAKNRNLFTCATSSDEVPDLFIPVDQMMGQSGSEPSGPPQLPYYMAVRLTRKKRKQHRSSPTPSNSVSSYEEEVPFGNKLKREFWFAVPRNKADSIYHFLLQWSPEKYGKDTTLALDESSLTGAESTKLDDRGFIILDSTADESLSGDRLSFGFE